MSQKFSDLTKNMVQEISILVSLLQDDNDGGWFVADLASVTLKLYVLWTFHMN